MTGPSSNQSESSAAAVKRWKLPSSWAWSTVGEVGSVRLGRQKSPDVQRGRDPTKYLRAANIGTRGLDLSDVLEMDFDPDERQTYALRTGDVVLAEASGSSAQVGRSAIWSGEIPDCCYQNTVIRFRPHAPLPEFALLVFRHLWLAGFLASVARGVGIQHLGAKGLIGLPFPLPPHAEQARIATAATEKLRSVDEAERSLTEALSKNTIQTKLILEAATFGKLHESPPAQRGMRSKAQVSARQPPRSQGKGGNGEPSADFADLLAQSLPKGWKWVRVDEVGEIRLGRQRSPKHEHGEHLWPYLRVANVFENAIDASDIRRMNFTPAERKQYRLVKGDILLNEGQSPELVGRPAMYLGSPPNVGFQNHLIRFRPTAVDGHFALLVFRYFLHAGYFTRAARWSTNIANLSVGRFSAMPFPLPPLNEQSRIAVSASKLLDASEEQRRSVADSLSRIGSLRKGVLWDAVRGALVEQDHSDGSGTELLARLGRPPSEMPRKGPFVKARKPAESAGVRPLYETMKSFRARVAPERLFDAAGYNRDSVADVEAFYLALRSEMGKRIREVKSSGGTLLEVSQDAAR